jgi:hypothetical protein
MKVPCPLKIGLLCDAPQMCAIACHCPLVIDQADEIRKGWSAGPAPLFVPLRRSGVLGAMP